LNRGAGPRTSSELNRTSGMALQANRSFTRRNAVTAPACCPRQARVRAACLRPAARRPVGENDWMEKNFNSKANHWAAARFGTGYESLQHGLASRGGVLQKVAPLRKPRTKTQREERKERGNQGSIFSAGAGEEKASGRRTAARTSTAARIKRQKSVEP
jgi:hypothetical protein